MMAFSSANSFCFGKLSQSVYSPQCSNKEIVYCQNWTEAKVDKNFNLYNLHCSSQLLFQKRTGMSNNWILRNIRDGAPAHQSRRKSDCLNGFRRIIFLISVYNSMFGILNVTDRILLTSKLCWKICLKVLIMAIFMLIYLHKIKWLLDRTSSEPRQRELEINLTFLVWARARLAHY